MVNFLNSDTGGGCQLSTWNFLGLKSDPALCGNVMEYAPQKWYCENLNVTFYHIWHGNPLHNPFDGHKRFSCPLIQHYGGEILDRMVEHKWFGEEYIIFTDIGVHLAIFNPIVVYRRMVDFRESAERYIKASLENNKKPAKIVYKGMCYNRSNLASIYATVSSTVLYRIQEIAEYVFSGSCVKVFDFWRMTESVFDHQKVGEIHPGRGEGSSIWLKAAMSSKEPSKSFFTEVESSPES